MRATLAAGLTLAQLLIAFALAPGKSGQVPAPYSSFPESALATRYLQLNNWDSQHYRSIARSGYQIPTFDLTRITSEDVHSDRANVGFFPAYPLAARALSELTGLLPELSLLLLSQLACFAFWFYVILLLEEFQVLKERRGTVLLSILVYPSSFFLVLGYSESLFLASLFGMIYWTHRARRTHDWLLVAFHGMILCSTRLVGVPLIIYPAGLEILGWFRNRERRIRAGALFASLLSLGGVGLFFGYCQHRFGVWNLYFILQQKGWQNFPDYFVFVKPWKFLPRFFFEDTMESVSRASVPVTMAWFTWLVVRRREWTAVRLSLVLVAFLSFYVAAAGKANAHMDSMIRYTLPTFSLLMILSAERGSLADVVRRSGQARLWLALTGSALLNLYLCFMFLRGHWVA